MDGLSSSHLRQFVWGVLVATTIAAGRPAIAQHSGPSTGANRLRPADASVPKAGAQVPGSSPSENQVPAWSAALQRHGQQRIEYAYDLASRGAIHSAQHELLKVLGAVAQTLDTDQGSRRHSEALTSAQTALEEAADFLRAGPQGSRPPSVAVIANAHRTTLLHQAETQNVTPLVAMQLYYSHAVGQFAAAAGGQRVAAEALFGLGRVMAMMRDHPLSSESDKSQLSEQRMLVYYQAAWTIDPRHYRAANEYGVLLARFQQWEQACQAFEYSVAQKAEPQNTRNLAIAYERIGERDLARQALQLSQSLSSDRSAGGSASSGTKTGGVAPAVEWVDLNTFSQRGSPAGWSSHTPHEQAGPQMGEVHVSGGDGTARQQRTTANPAKSPSANSKGLIPNDRLSRWKSVFKRN